jgi:hypothetical protein
MEKTLFYGTQRTKKTNLTLFLTPFQSPGKAGETYNSNPLHKQPQRRPSASVTCWLDIHAALAPGIAKFERLTRGKSSSSARSKRSTSGAVKHHDVLIFFK